MFDDLTVAQIRALVTDIGEWANHPQFGHMTVPQVRAAMDTLLVALTVVDGASAQVGRRLRAVAA